MFHYYNQAIVGNKGSETSLKDTLIKEKQFFNFKYIFECFFMMICPNPFFDFFVGVIGINGDDNIHTNQYYFLSDLFLALMFFRLFFFYRTLMNFSDHSDAYSIKICKQYGFTSGLYFALKVKMITNPLMLVFYDLLC